MISNCRRIGRWNRSLLAWSRSAGVRSCIYRCRSISRSSCADCGWPARWTMSCCIAPGRCRRWRGMWWRMKAPTCCSVTAETAHRPSWRRCWLLWISTVARMPTRRQPGKLVVQVATVTATSTRLNCYPYLPLQLPIGESAHDEASTRVHAIHPPGLPQPVTPGWNPSPRASHPTVTHDARRGGDDPHARDRELRHRHQPIPPFTSSTVTHATSCRTTWLSQDDPGVVKCTWNRG